MRKSLVLGSLLVLGVAALSSAPAQAQVLASASNTNAFVNGCGLFVLDLNGAAAGTNLQFTLPASASNRRVAVLFNGECSVASLDDFTWLDVNVQILNGAGAVIATLSPSSSDNAFCTSTGDNALDHWVSASTNGSVLFGPGGAVNLSVRVTAQLQVCAPPDQYRLDDLSTIVVY